MKQRPAWIGAALVLALVLGVWLVGCDSSAYRADTRIGADGRVSRAINQPESVTPPEARDPALWQGTTWTQGLDWDGRIAELPAAERSDKHTYFAAWGEFASAAALPRTYVMKAPPGLRDGELLVDYQREDLGLVVSHRWRETLTDVVEVHDVQVARRELADLVIRLGKETLDRILGEAYDTSALAEWADTTGRAWFYELVETGLVNRGFGGTSDEIGRTLAPLWERRLFSVTQASGALVTDKEFDARFEAFLKQLLRDKIRRRDGKPVPEAKIEELWLLSFGDRPEELRPWLERYDAVRSAVILEAFGTEEKASEAWELYERRMFGLYNEPVFGETREFRYSLELPGRIVETNGLLLSEHEVLFAFGASEAFPAGYAMKCRSLEHQPAVERQLLGRVTLTDTAALLRYVELVTDEPSLREALVESAKAKSLEPFLAARTASAAPERPGHVRAAFDAMARLLELDAPAR